MTKAITLMKTAGKSYKNNNILITIKMAQLEIIMMVVIIVATIKMITHLDNKSNKNSIKNKIL